jgi:hypothetical protein
MIKNERQYRMGVDHTLKPQISGWMSGHRKYRAHRS